MSCKYFKIFLLSILISSGFTACRKFVDIKPPANQVPSEIAFANDASATAAVNGLYSEMISNSSQFSSGFTTLYTGMSADEIDYYSSSFRDEFVNNQITIVNHANLTFWFWSPAYRYIYTANLCLTELEKSNNINAQLKKILKGECLFIRAFCYFHLVNLFGGVPLILNTDYNENASIPRSTQGEIYNQIILDLVSAQSLLSDSYPVAEKVRVNRMAATSLLAKVYLYTRNWEKAETEASSVINSTLYSLESALNSVFLKGSTETIWQLRTISNSINTVEGNLILPASSSSVPTFVLTNTLFSSFEPGDNRKNAWTYSRVFPLPSGPTVNIPYKYKVFGNNAPITEYYVVIRLAELYLIRAEARMNMDNISGSQDDLNKIRNRAGLANTIAVTKSELQIAIESERRAELFCEWGNRWYDLKRTNRSNDILSPIKGPNWQITDTLWPIPQDQINLNGSLDQNSGY